MRQTRRWIPSPRTVPVVARGGRSGRGLGALLLAGLSLLVWTEVAVAQQQGTISGTVVAEGSMRPLAGAQVVAGGVATLTNSQGGFRLERVPGDQVEVRVVLLGYRPASRSVPVGSTGVRFALEERALELDAIVVTGTAGATQKRAIGNAVTTVDAAEITTAVQPATVQQLLSSRVAGVSILKGSGEVGTGAATAIRGVGSLALSAEPLIYVDGVRVDNNANAAGRAFRSGSGASRINDIDPNDIESIEVIKGPAAATLYGTEASNGVIQIITKRGAAGETRWTFESKQGANFLQNPTEVFPTVWGKNKAGDLISLNIIQNDIDQGFGSPFRTGHVQEYLASVSGGSQDLRYYVSGSYGQDQGIVSYNWKNKLDLRSNLQYQLRDKLELGVNLGLVRSLTRAASTAQPITTHIIWGLPGLKDAPTRGYLAVRPEDYHQVEGFEDVDRSTLGVQLQHHPFGWLTHRLALGGDFGTIRSTGLWPRTEKQPGPHGTASRGLKRVANHHSSYTTVDYSATASLDLGSRLSTATSSGVQFFRKQFKTDETEGQIFPVPGVETVSSAAIRFASEDFLENRTLGMFLQQQLAWNDRIFVTGAVRGDDNSAFGQNYDFVVYPKLSASWVISEEPFFESVPVLNTMKLRAAWGQAGQQPDVFAAIRLYQPATGPGGVSTLTPENLGNPDLKPEVGEELELGLDASLFADRLGVEFTYYNQTTRDAIVPRPVKPSVGFPGLEFVNLGEVRNTGYEMLLNAGLVRRRAVDWNVTLAYSTNQNEVVSLGGVVIPPNFAGQRHIEGYPLNSIFLKRVVNAEFDASGKLVNVLCEGGDRITGGGAPVPCSEAGTSYFGQPIPTWQGSVGNTLNLFGSLQLYGLVDFVGGHTRVNGDVGASHIFFRNSKCINTRCDPYLAAYDAMGGWMQTGVMDAGFAKLRTVSASYTLPGAVLRRLGAGNGTFTVAGHNLARLWTAESEKYGHPATDPEIRDQSSVLAAYNQERWPQFTSVVASIRLAF